MMTSSLLKEIKIEIRSLLVSSPYGLREDELCRDYTLYNSQRSLPYQIFGYSTIKDFLNSLTDILYRSSDGCLHPIVDQSTEHIFKFVQQQRSKKKRKQMPSLSHQQEYQYTQPSKPLITRNKQKRTGPSMINSSSQQKHRTVDTIKPVPMMKQMKIMYDNKVKNEEQSFARLKSTMNYSSPSFERINVTNDLLQGLLSHFRRQQQK